MQILLTELVSKDEDCPAAVAGGVSAIDADAAPRVSHWVLAGAAGAAGVHVHALEADVAFAHHLLKVALTNVPGNACKPAMI